MNNMKTEAMVLVRKGDADQAFDRRAIDLPALQSNEVLIESEAFGLNYADVMARRGLYREAPPMPCVIGYELVGTVSSVGSAVDKTLIGQRVVAFCRFGGYGKHVVTWDYAVVPIAEMKAEEALVLCTQAVTAYYMAEYLSPIQAGEKVLIHAAAGGVGTVLIQLAKLKGAEVFAKIGDESKRSLVKELGADHVVNYKQSDYGQTIQSILGSDRLDVSYNPVGGSTSKTDMHLLGSGGRLVLFGGSELGRAKWGIFSSLNFVRKMGLIIPVGLMIRSKSVLGVNMLKIADNRPKVLQHCLLAVVELYQQGKIKPQVGGVYAIGDLQRAHADLEGGKTVGKLTVKW
jgi:NADPH:quinone reductase-like Zn-dependent oxidoreductase